jgi:tetratricopeptide (TPR) repeat protein
MPTKAISVIPLWTFLFLQALFVTMPSNAQDAGKEGSKPQIAAESAELHLGRGYEAMRNERYDEAIQEFRAALALDSTLVMRARFPLAVAMFEQRNYPASRAEFEKVRLEGGEQPGLFYYLGRIDQEEHDYKRAIANLSKAATAPPFPDTFFYLGLAYLKDADEPNAEKWLKEAVRVNPNDSRALYQLATLYRKQGRTEEANETFGRTREKKAASDKLTQLKVECGQELAHGLTEKARSLCEQLDDTNDAEKLTALGILYGEHGFLEDALAPLRRAAELSPRSPLMQYNLAYTYFQLGRFREARSPLEAATHRWPDLFPLRSLYGNVLWKLGDTMGAYDALSYAHKLNPDDKPTEELLYQSILILAGQSENKPATADAVRYWKEAAKLRPSQPEPHHRLSLLYAKSGRPQMARQEQKEADRLGAAQVP